MHACTLSSVLHMLAAYVSRSHAPTMHHQIHAAAPEAYNARFGWQTNSCCKVEGVVLMTSVPLPKAIIIKRQILQFMQFALAN